MSIVEKLLPFLKKFMERVITFQMIEILRKIKNESRMHPY